MGDDERNWLDKFKQINGLTVSTPALNRIGAPLPILSKRPRKGPHRLGRIFEGDQIQIRVMNLVVRRRKGARISK